MFQEFGEGKVKRSEMETKNHDDGGLNSTITCTRESEVGVYEKQNFQNFPNLAD